MPEALVETLDLAAMAASDSLDAALAEMHLQWFPAQARLALMIRLFRTTVLSEALAWAARHQAAMVAMAAPEEKEETPAVGYLWPSAQQAMALQCLPMPMSMWAALVAWQEMAEAADLLREALASAATLQHWSIAEMS